MKKEERISRTINKREINKLADKENLDTERFVSLLVSNRDIINLGGE